MDQRSNQSSRSTIQHRRRIGCRVPCRLNVNKSRHVHVSDLSCNNKRKVGQIACARTHTHTNAYIVCVCAYVRMYVCMYIICMYIYTFILITWRKQVYSKHSLHVLHMYELYKRTCIVVSVLPRLPRGFALPHRMQGLQFGHKMERQT